MHICIAKLNPSTHNHTQTTHFHTPTQTLKYTRKNIYTNTKKYGDGGLTGFFYNRLKIRYLGL